MYALTLIQPWATLVFAHGKDIENRMWVPPDRLVGQRIAVHAGRAVDHQLATDAHRAGYAMPDPLPAGALLGTVTLAEVHHAAECRLRCSLWADPDAFHWMLTDPRPMPEPVPCRGRQRLWTVPYGQMLHINRQSEVARR